ncbi:MAG: sugar phosphate nucleotidyltransferase [Methanocellales archaeon]
MKVIIPAAGAGKRLHPHTYTKPKPMVSVAGKPIIGHILDRMIDLNPEEVIVVVGYMKEKLIEYINSHYSPFFKKISFAIQEEQLGLGHAIYVAKDFIGASEVMIALGDMIFKAGYIEFKDQYLSLQPCDGAIGVKKIDDPRNYGIVTLNKNGEIKELVEKPKYSKSKLGIAGVYFIKNTTQLFKALEDIIKNRNNRNKKEIQLTDALQLMVEEGAKLRAFKVHNWYDCGRAEALLEANRVLLGEMPIFNYDFKNSAIIKPVAIASDVKIENSVIGPYASISEGCVIENSIIANSIIGANTKIANMYLNASIIGDNVKLIGKVNSLNIGDSSSIEF